MTYLCLLKSQQALLDIMLSTITSTTAIVTVSTHGNDDKTFHSISHLLSSVEDFRLGGGQNDMVIARQHSSPLLRHE